MAIKRQNFLCKPLTCRTVFSPYRRDLILPHEEHATAVVEGLEWLF